MKCISRQVVHVFNFLNVPRACGANTRKAALAAPALSPNTVTLLGSPPKYLINLLTHRNPSIWSNIPALPGISSVSRDK